MRTLTREWIAQSIAIALLMSLAVWVLVSLTTGMFTDIPVTDLLIPRGETLQHSVTLFSWVALVGFAMLLWLGGAERRRGQRALPYQSLERLLLASPSGVILTDNKLNICEINPVAAKMFGVGPGVFGSTLEELFALDNQASATKGLPAPGANPIQLTGRTADGESFPVLVSRVRLGNRGDDLTATFVHQLSDELTLAKSRRHAERQYQALFNGIPDGVFRSLPDGTLVSANPALIEMLGGEPSAGLTDRLVTTNFYMDPTNRRELTAELVRRGTVHNLVLQLKRCDGEIIPVLANIRAVRDPDNRPILFEGTLTNLTGFEIHPIPEGS